MMERVYLEDFGVAKGLLINPYLKVTNPGVFEKLLHPALFYHPEGKFEPGAENVVWLCNKYRRLYEVEKDLKRQPYHRQRHEDIEIHNVVEFPSTLAPCQALPVTPPSQLLETSMPERF
jgi:hypothetical protein